MHDDDRADILIVGGGLGGVAAALAATGLGARVVLTEETDWLGGQMSSQGVPPDEHPWIESFGAPRSYRRMRHAVRDIYRAAEPLTDEAKSLLFLNPGGGRVSALCHEPRITARAMTSLLTPAVESGLLTVHHRFRPQAATLGPDDSVRAVTFIDLEAGEQCTIEATLVLDATETGDVLDHASVEHVTGFESRDDTQENFAPKVAQPLNMQAASWCFAVEHHRGEDFTIDRPADYDYWRSARPDYWPGPQFGWTVPHPHTLEPRRHHFEPNPDDAPAQIVADQSKDNGADELWTFRRLVARKNFVPGTYTSDTTLVNWPMIDYVEGPLFGQGDELRDHHRQRAKDMSLSFLYWLQTEAPRPDGGAGYPGLQLNGRAMGTADGFAKEPYLRESRRIVAVQRVTSADISVASRGARGAVRYHDSVGIGAYRIDIHPSTGGDNYIDVAAHPFEIPLGALVPVRVTNVLAAAKNIGTTHITNGCYRLHPVEWSIGEAAGILAAYCLRIGTRPHQVHEDDRHLAEYHRLLLNNGAEIHWPQVAPW